MHDNDDDGDTQAGLFGGFHVFHKSLENRVPRTGSSDDVPIHSGCLSVNHVTVFLSTFSIVARILELKDGNNVEMLTF